MLWTSRIQAEFGYVLLVSILYGMECLLIGFIIPGRARSKIFTEDYMKQNFGTEHTKAFNEDIKAGGYPDTGSGLYTKKLTYEQWYSFNNAQRAHMNTVEFMASTLIFLLVAGVYFPIPAAAVGLAMVIGRLIYCIGYVMGGPTGRTIGVLINDLSILGLFVLGFISCIYFIQNQDL